jgi:flagellar hook-associated protein 2
MAISSTGIGSGLDVNSIVSQLVALEKQPLKALQSRATGLQSQLSTLGKIQSQVSTLATAAGKLGSVLTWKGTTSSSSNTTALTVTSASTATPAAFSLEISQLAKAQSLAIPAGLTDPALPDVGTQFGTGTLTIQVGSNAAVNVEIDPGKGSLSEIAAAINGSAAGVSATVLRDGTGKENLLLRAKDTGAAGTFTIAVTDDDGNSADTTGLSRLNFQPGNQLMQQTQAAQNLQGTVNGIAVTSSKNTLTDTVPGITISALQVTTAPVTVEVTRDNSVVTKAMQDFVTAYNDLNTLLKESTKYDAATKVAGVFQGDTATNNLARALSGLVSAPFNTGSTFTGLSQVGLTAKLGGALELNSSKFTEALADPENLQKLFANFGGTDATNGFGLRMRDFSNGLLAATGTVTSKNDALKRAIDNNQKDQDKVTDRATLAEARLRKQYSALDSKMASLSALNTYVTQQVAAWNKSSG